MMSPATRSAAGTARGSPSRTTRARGRHLSQGGNGRFGSRRLDVTHDSVEQHHAADGDGFVRQRGIAFVEPEGGRYARRDQKKDHQDVLELREKLPPSRHWRLGRQLVRTVTKEAFLRLARTQTRPRVAGEGDDHLVKRPLIFGHHPWFATIMSWMRDPRDKRRARAEEGERGEAGRILGHTP
jgi:hypothetical protein